MLAAGHGTVSFHNNIRNDPNSFLVSMGVFPRPHFGSCFVEETREVSFAHLFAGLRAQQIPQGLILVKDLQVALLASGCDFVSPEQKAIREAID